MLSLINSRLRPKLFMAYAGAFIIIFVVVGIIIHALVSDIIRQSIESELTKTTETIQTMVRSSADVSIKNYMRAVAEKCLDEARQLYTQVKRGRITEDEAKRRARDSFLSQTIGETGRVYCLDSQGIMVVHHKRSLLGVDMSGLQFVKDQVRLKGGYLEYDWREPLEKESRAKAVYMVYFEPWDWIITASTYREEFGQLVNVDDFRKRLFELRSGKEGYLFVLDYAGYLLIHPHLEGVHFNDYGDPELSAVAQRIVKERDGHFDYMWMNPGDSTRRKKVVYFKDVPEMGWVVASSSYYNDFKKPLDAIGYVLLVALALAILLMVPVSMGIGALITRPLKGLQNNFARAANGDFSVRMEQHSRDELGLMAGYFNSFMEKLTEYSNSLQSEIAFRKRTEKQLIAMDKTKSLFLASASHELRTPLTSIIGFVRLMEKNFHSRFLPLLGPLDPVGRHARQFEKNLAIVRIEADRLGRLVNDLLDLSKIEAGHMEWRDRELFVDAVLKRAAEAISAYAAEKPAIAFNCEPFPPGVHFVADEDRILQVLINLLSNAFKNTDSGEVTLSALQTPEGVEFSVCDTGRGIPPEDREKIFDIFYQGQDENRRSSKVFGTGLGLAICRQIVSHYGGELVVNSEVGRGSCFLFSIPTVRGRNR